MARAFGGSEEKNKKAACCYHVACDCQLFVFYAMQDESAFSSVDESFLDLFHTSFDVRPGGVALPIPGRTTEFFRN